MPKKYSAQMQIDNSGSLREAFVYADNEAEATKILNAMHPGQPVRLLRVVEDEKDSSSEATETNSKKGGCGTIVLLVVAVLAYGAWEAITGQKSAPNTASEAPGTEQIQEESSTLSAPSSTEIPAIPEISVTDSDAPSNTSDTTAQSENSIEKADSQAEDFPPATPPPLPPQEPSAAGKLATFAVRVKTASGEVTQMQISAKSEEDAYRILRDYRGNPEVVAIEQVH